MRRTLSTEVGAALKLFGVTYAEAGNRGPAVADTELVTVRELAVIVVPTAYAAVEPSTEHALSAGGVIAEYAKRTAVLPAPVGVVFRSRQAVTRWLELHYVALSDALSSYWLSGNGNSNGAANSWCSGLPTTSIC